MLDSELNCAFCHHGRVIHIYTGLNLQPSGSDGLHRFVCQNCGIIVVIDVNMSDDQAIAKFKRALDFGFPVSAIPFKDIKPGQFFYLHPGGHGHIRNGNYAVLAFTPHPSCEVLEIYMANDDGEEVQHERLVYFGDLGKYNAYGYFRFGFNHSTHYVKTSDGIYVATYFARELDFDNRVVYTRMSVPEDAFNGLHFA